MKILHLSGSHDVWGGNEEQLKTLIGFSEKMGVENHIFCFEDSPVHKFCEENNILHCVTPRLKDYSLKLAKILKRYMIQKEINLIHIHTSNSVLTFMITDILYKLGVPCVFSKKGISDKSSFFSRLKYNYKGINKVICVAEAVKESFSKILAKENKKKLLVIHDGIIIKKYNPAEINLREKYNITSKYLVGNIANHSTAKDLPTFIKVIDYVVNHLGRKDIHFIQIGKELEETPIIKQMVKDYKVSSYITITGQLNNAKLLIPQFDIFIVTSKTEGGPLTIPESFLARVPVITTKVGITETMKNGENGFLTEVGDYKKLAEKLDILIDNEDVKEKFVRSSLDLLHQEFDAEKCAEKVVKLYKSLL